MTTGAYVGPDLTEPDVVYKLEVVAQSDGTTSMCLFVRGLGDLGWVLVAQDFEPMLSEPCS